MYFLLPLVKLFGIKVVLTYHSINYKHTKWGIIAKWILQLGEVCGVVFADKVIVVSNATKDFLSKKYREIDSVYIPNGVNLIEIPHSSNSLNDYQLRPKKYVFTACRFDPEKGLHDLISAYQEIESPGFKLVIAGDADYETTYSRNIKRAAAEDKNIILTGFISGRLLRELYSNAGLFVLPSYYEGLPISLLEAMSYGLPVLASNIPGTKEVSLPTFRYFPAGNVDELARRMVILFKKGITGQEKKEGRLFLRKNYNWDRIAEQTWEVYKSVLRNE